MQTIFNFYSDIFAMKNSLFTSILLFIFSYTAFSQNCVPNNNCSAAPKICMQGYIGTTAGFSAGSEPINCPNGQQWGVHNDQWIAFMPTQSNIIINVEVVGNCSSGAGVQALIHTDCNSDPIDCDVDCGGDPSVGSGINFTPGATYYLRIDGCNGAICPIKITYSPDGAIMSPPDPINPKWPGNFTIAGPATIDCPGKTATYTAPFNVCATAYHWTIQSGDAEIINDFGTEYTDNNLGQPGTDVTITAPNRHIVRVKFTGTCPPQGTVKLCVEGSNGCHSTGEICKNILVKCPPDVIKKVKICPNEDGWNDPDPKIGGPYPPGDPCGTPQTHVARLTDNNGCEFNLNLQVTRLCEPPFIKNLGQILLCPGEVFKICNQQFDSTTVGYQSVTCLAVPKQDANLAPPKGPQCDSTKNFEIIQAKIIPIVVPGYYKLPCPTSKVTLKGNTSFWEPTGPAFIKSVGYQWQDYTPAVLGGQGWADIAGATKDSLVVTKEGDYRLRIRVIYYYNDALGTQRTKQCENYSAIIKVDSSDSQPPPAPIFDHSGLYCDGGTYTFNITNPDPNLKYRWLRQPQKDTVSKTSSATLLLKAPRQILCVQAINDCNQKSPMKCDTIIVREAPATAQLFGPDGVCAGSQTSYCILNAEPDATYSWTVPPPATFVNGPGANCITVTWPNDAQPGNITVKGVNQCAERITDFKIRILGQPGVITDITGPNDVCLNDTSTYIAIYQDTTNAKFKWVLEPNDIGSIVGPNDRDTLIIKWLKTGHVKLKLVNPCGEGGYYGEDINVKNPPIPAVILGIKELCAGSNGVVYNIDTVRAGVTYTWNLTGGGTIVSGQGSGSITVNWTTFGNHKVQVTAANECGTPLSELNVKVNEVPKANAGAAQQVCGLNGKLNATPSVGTGIWTIINQPTGGNAVVISPTDPKSDVQVSVCGVYTFQWLENNVGCRDSAQTTIDFSEPPLAINAKEKCDLIDFSYTVTFEVKGCKPPYKVIDANSGAQVGTLNTAPYNFTSGKFANNTTYRFVIEDAFGCKGDTLVGKRKCDCDTKADSMNVNVKLDRCEDQSVTVVGLGGFKSDGNDIQQYALHGGSGSTLEPPVIAINKSGTFSFDKTKMNYGEIYYVSAIAGDQGGTVPNDTVKLTDQCLQVSPGQPVVWHKNPQPDAGVIAEICGNKYVLKAIKDIGAGTWSLKRGPAGATANFTPTTSPGSTVDVSQFGTYVFVWEENNFGCIGRDSVEITFKPDDLAVASPAQPFVKADYECDNIGENYRITLQFSGGTQPYRVDTLSSGTGWTATGNSYTSFWIPSNSSDSLFIRDASDCKVVAIGLNHKCDCLTEANGLTIQNSLLCEFDTLSVTSVVKPDPNDIVEYVVSSAANVVGDPGSIIMRNSTGKFTLGANMTCGREYYVSVLVGNESKSLPGTVDLGSECSRAVTEPIEWICQPVATPGLADTICGLNYNMNGGTNVGQITWTQTNGPGTSQFGSPNSGTSNVSVSTAGVYTFLMSVDNKGCKDSKSVVISYGENPKVTAKTEINDYTTGFTVTLDITNGMMPYNVDGKPVAGTTYVGDSIKCSLGVVTPYNYTVYDAFGCATIVTGTEKCECRTDAGTLPPTEYVLCSDQELNGIALPSDLNLEGKDVHEFILSEQCGPRSSTNIIARNKNGKFSFLPGMQFDKNYYITLIAGDSLQGSNGQVKFSDICLDSTECSTLRFLQKTVASAGPDGQVCGLTYNLNAKLSLAAGKSIGSWEQVSGPGTANFADFNLPTSDVTVDICGTYRFKWSEDNNGCNSSDTVTVIFSEPPTIILVNAACNNIYTGYQVKLGVLGCGSPYTVTGMSGGTLSGDTLFTSNLINAPTINYSFQVQDKYGCTSVINGDLDCNCKGTALSGLNSLENKVCVDAQGGGTVSAELVGVITDANDGYMYILTDVANGVGTVWDRNKTGVFTFKTGMQYGKTYYIAGVVGDTLPNGQVDVSAANKCLLLKSVPVIFNQTPQVTCATGGQVDCIKTFRLNASSDVGVTKWETTSSPPGTYPSFTNPSVGNTTVTVNDTGQYIFRWVAINAGCSDTCEVPVTFKEYPTPKYTPPLYDCNTFKKDTAYTVQFTLTGTAPFRLLAGSSQGVINGNVLTSTSIKSGLGYKFIIKDAKSCDSVVIDGSYLCACKAEAGSPLPDLTFCEGIDTTIELSNLIVGEETGGVWSVYPPIGGLSGSKFNTRGLGSGIYEFSYTIGEKVTIPPCDGDTSRVNIVINPTPKADAGFDQGLGCKIREVTIGGSGTTIDTSLSYIWSGRISSLKTPNDKITVATDSGTFVLTVKYPASGCYDSDTVIVSKTTSDPKANLVVTDPLCYGEKNGGVILTMASGKPPYKVNFVGLDAIYTRKTDNLSYKFLPAGSYPLTVEDSNGCILKQTILLKDPDPLEISLGDDITVDLISNGVQLYVEKNYPLDTIQSIVWTPSPSDSLNIAARDTLTVRPLEPTIYCVVVTTDMGCKAEDCVRITIDKKRPIYIPNMFRPEGEGPANRKFGIFADGRYVEKIEDFEIFNRWGDIMYKLQNFQPNDPDNGWDGTFKGKLMDPGVYVYWAKIRFIDGSVEIYKGDVTLIR